MAAPNFPNAPTTNQEYTAPSGTLYKWDGVVWKSLAGAQHWSVSGNTITPTDATKRVAIAAPAGTPSLQWSSRTVKGRLNNHAAGEVMYWSINGALDAASTAWVLDDVAKPLWAASIDSTSDIFSVRRAAPSLTTSTELLRLDAGGGLLLPGTEKNCLTFGNTTHKGRLVVPNGAGQGVHLTSNLALNAAGNAWIQDDVAQPSWRLHFGNGDSTLIYRIAAGGTPVLLAFTLNNLGDIQISGSTATKATGTTWANPSDKRIKRNISDYETGLDALLRLHPVQFEHNGLAGTTDGQVGYGYMADEIACVMPEMVTTIKKKLREEDEEEIDLQLLDTSNITLALVNAVKELAARVALLEA